MKKIFFLLLLLVTCAYGQNRIQQDPARGFTIINNKGGFNTNGATIGWFPAWNGSGFTWTEGGTGSGGGVTNGQPFVYFGINSNSFSQSITNSTQKLMIGTNTAVGSVVYNAYGLSAIPQLYLGSSTITTPTVVIDSSGLGVGNNVFLQKADATHYMSRLLNTSGNAYDEFLPAYTLQHGKGTNVLDWAVNTGALGHDAGTTWTINGATWTWPHAPIVNGGAWAFPASIAGTTTNGYGGIMSFGNIASTSMTVVADITAGTIQSMYPANFITNIAASSGITLSGQGTHTMTPALDFTKVVTNQGVGYLFSDIISSNRFLTGFKASRNLKQVGTTQTNNFALTQTVWWTNILGYTSCTQYIAHVGNTNFHGTIKDASRKAAWTNIVLVPLGGLTIEGATAKTINIGGGSVDMIYNPDTTDWGVQ